MCGLGSAMQDMPGNESASVGVTIRYACMCTLTLRYCTGFKFHIYYHQL
jgi:hypothetical protein